ncbi:prepilin-type N-terminal cleavage/methylation domain-containing protein [Xylophilus sp. Kf1]|nr:prepilin-type N-terminal cleavage/methylation domain-containing protein [Xylophilus sp. Kf1]
MASPRRARGFTLIEVLVALAVMALLAVLSWRGIDGLSRAREQARLRGDEVLALQAGLAQWGVDLDAVTERQAGITPLEWDGRALRITRRGNGDPADGLRVAAWSRRNLADGSSWWLRWESGPLMSVAQWTQAWDQAALWAQNPGEAERQREVPVARVDNWQIFYYINNAWANALSSGDSATPAPAPQVIGNVAATKPTLVPDGVRLVLSLSPGQAFAGTLTRDWVAPGVTPSRP